MGPGRQQRATCPRTGGGNLLRLFPLFRTANPVGRGPGNRGTRQPPAGCSRHLDQQSDHLCAALLVQLQDRLLAHRPRIGLARTGSLAIWKTRIDGLERGEPPVAGLYLSGGNQCLLGRVDLLVVAKASSAATHLISCVQNTEKTEDMGASDNQTEIRISPEDRVDIELKAIEVGSRSGDVLSA